MLSITSIGSVFSDLVLAVGAQGRTANQSHCFVAFMGGITSA